MNRKRVISLDIDSISYNDSLHKIIELAQGKAPSYACFANSHMTIEAHKDQNFAGQVNSASLVLPDGMPLVKAFKFFYGVEQERVAGMDVMPDLLRLAEKINLSVFFFGTTPDILQGIRSKIESDFSGLKIAGMLSPPFDRSLDDPSYIDAINFSGANLVFVALGCPKQEKWMASHSAKINAVLLGVGGAFPVFAGITSRAPLLMRNLSLEWLYRLLQEPNRLFLRYLTTNSLFLFLAFRYKLGQIFGRQK